MDPTLYIGSDHAGFELKAYIISRLGTEFPKLHIHDLGTSNTDSTHYPIYAEKVGRSVVEKQAVGILVCGSGIGVSIAANKVKGVRAALCWDATSARLSRQHNGANVLCLGARLTGKEVAMDAVRVFLQTSFEGGRHSDRLDMIRKLEENR